MTEQWEYEQEAIEHLSQQNYLNSCPVICRTCRWLDVYYELGCVYGCYPNEDRCILFTNHLNYHRFKWFSKDLHYLFWQFRVWFQEKILKQRRNHIGSWQQWEYTEDTEDEYTGGTCPYCGGEYGDDWSTCDCEDAKDGYGNYWEPDYDQDFAD